MLDSSIDLIDKVAPKDVKRSTKDEVNIKMQQAKSSNNNALTNKAISAEEANIMRKNIQQVNAKAAEKNKYKSLPGFDRFKLNLYNTVRDQVAAVRQEYQDYSEVNAEYEGEDIIMKADVMKDIPDEAIPSIDIYIDRSGS